MRSERIDGNDVGEVHAAVTRARELDGPTFIEAMTYRQRGHSRSDPAAYRPAGELERWLERDPILLHERVLAQAGVPRERLVEIADEAARTVGDALERALAYPDPDPASRFEHVFA
jgi:pyruvate dehydrogenase E1 component alpha subunit